jgi:hypothetical protein
MNSNLLKEAIADAKAVRATALANAKAALEEAFNQRFEAVFADKLREDSAVEEDDVAPVAETCDKDKVGATKPSKSDGTKGWSAKNIDSAGKPTVKNITPNTVPSAKDGGDATKGWSKDNKGNAMDGTPAGVKENAEEGKMEEEAVEETVTNEDLEEIIRELEMEAGADPMGDPAAGGAPDAGAGAPPMDAPPEGGAPEGGAPEGGEPIMSGDTITITKTPAPEPAPEAPPGEVPGGEAPAPGGEAPPMEEEEINISELLASLNEESKEDEEDEKEETGEKEKADENLVSQLNEAIAQRDEAYKTVEVLRNSINEINLLNAKLLYTNKLFKEFNMNNDRKLKIVEAFDLCKVVREVKMTYANWCESLNFGGNIKRKAAPSVSNLTTITEGMASKPVASTKPSPVITEGVNDMANRFQKLAGINLKK